jgi:hypothetical protein
MPVARPHHRSICEETESGVSPVGRWVLRSAAEDDARDGEQARDGVREARDPVQIRCVFQGAIEDASSDQATRRA